MLRRVVSHNRSTAKWSTKPITSSDSLPLLVIRLTEQGILADGSIVNPCRLQRIYGTDPPKVTRRVSIGSQLQLANENIINENINISYT